MSSGHYAANAMVATDFDSLTGRAAQGTNLCCTACTRGRIGRSMRCWRRLLGIRPGGGQVERYFDYFGRYDVRPGAL